ncbi:MAG TPA: cupredoxin family copper-binding protein [Pyrinomonadaceae bacterium]|jgi:plastocyanin
MFSNNSRHRHATARLLLTACAALLIAALASSAAAKSRTHTVTLRGMKNVPATLVVKAGDTVVWKNADVVPHTATDRGKSFDSGSIEPGGSWSYVANRKGTYFYYCAYHPNTKGKLVVR